jgi:thiol-disulfide isomerase/thioredoxin
MKNLVLAILVLFCSNCYAETRSIQIFGADWCPPCQRLKGDLKNDKDLIKVFDETFYKVYNIDVTSVPLSQYGLTKIPTLRIWLWNESKKKWEIEKTVVGYNGPDSLIALLKGLNNGKLGNFNSSNEVRTKELR